MFGAFFRALGQLTDPRILRVIGGCILLSIACSVAVWFGVLWLLDSRLFELAWLESVVDWLGILLTVVLTLWLFPLLVSAFLGLFLESVARAVELRHYPALPPAKGLPVLAAIGASARFLALVVVANLALLLLLVFPPIYPVAYVVLNGHLLSREYFDLVAFRRMSTSEARALRRRHAGELLLLGCAIAFLFLVPLAGFVAPILATAMMVHRLEAWREVDGGSDC